MGNVKDQLETDIQKMNEKIVNSNEEMFDILNEQKNDQEKLLQDLNNKVEEGMKILEDGIEDTKDQMRSEISLIQQEASVDKDALRDLLSDQIAQVNQKINEDAIAFKEMLGKESEERQLETDLIRNV